MTRTRRRRKPSLGIPGLRKRGETFGWEVRHEKLAGGRMVTSLRTDDLQVAIERIGAIRTLMDRGDWALIDRMRAGTLHITDVVAAIRDGSVPKLRRNHHDRQTLGPVVERFLARSDATLAPRTSLAYRTLTAVILRHWGDDVIMEEVTVEEVERFLHAPRRGGQPWSAKSQRSYAALGGQIWDIAIAAEMERAHREEYTPSFTLNPWRTAQTPRRDRPRQVFLTREEWDDIESTSRGTVAVGLLGCAVLAGLRAGEILHLRTGIDVILDGPEPMLRIQARGGEHEWRPKTDRGQRDVPMAERLRRLLLEHQDLGFAGDRYFFRLPGEDRPMEYHPARDRVRGALEAAGIVYGRARDGVTWHTGRHTFSSWLAQDGVPLNIVAELIGDTLDVVYRTYAHLVPRTLREAVRVIDGEEANWLAKTTEPPTGGGESGANAGF